MIPVGQAAKELILDFHKNFTHRLHLVPPNYPWFWLTPKLTETVAGGMWLLALNLPGLFFPSFGPTKKKLGKKRWSCEGGCDFFWMVIMVCWNGNHRIICDFYLISSQCQVSRQVFSWTLSDEFLHMRTDPGPAGMLFHVRFFEYMFQKSWVMTRFIP